MHRSTPAPTENHGHVNFGLGNAASWLNASWSSLSFPEPDVFSLAVSAVDSAVYAGCEPSKLFVSRDGGKTWSELETLRQIPSASKWSYPPRPETSHVRSIAPSPRRAGLLLVGIELGGVMRSDDGGETWSDHRLGAQLDVHSLAWHPNTPDRVYQAAGGGTTWSDDEGMAWRAADEGRDCHYAWALAIDEDHLVAGVQGAFRVSAFSPG